MTYISDRVIKALGPSTGLLSFLQTSPYASLYQNPDVSNFVFGNPQEMPLAGLVSSLQQWIVPQNKDWFAYKDNVPAAQEAVATSLKARLGLNFDPKDVAMTTGAFAALSVSIATLVNPGDEVIYVSPPWFFYESIILTWGGVPVSIKVRPSDFDIDLEALEGAITPRTRILILNSPHNPTGKIYSAETLRKVSDILRQASARLGRPIFILSDEAYCRIVFAQRPCPSPTQFYDHTLLSYTYGKTLLAPGQRLGYIALAPTMPEREMMRAALQVSSLNACYVFPNALMQYALPDLEKLSVNINAIQRRRDYLISRLQSMGYQTNIPEGTFYVLVRSPDPDDQQFCERLASLNVLCLPGSLFEMPGYFRISLTASDTMVERAIPQFKEALCRT